MLTRALRRARRARRAVTLVEMVVSLSLTGIVLALVAAISLRQQRIVSDLGERSALSARLQEAASLLPIQLRAASPFDIRDARDTALEIRATIATAIVCDTVGPALVLAPVTGGESPYASFTSPVEAGDSAWLFVNEPMSTGWRGYAITHVGTRVPGACARAGPILSETESRAEHVTIDVASVPPRAVGTALRVTRPIRYSLYRAGDGAWYIGERDWNNTDARFNGTQPIAGPYLSASDGGLRFRYADSTGALLDTPVADPLAISTIAVELRGRTAKPVSVLGAVGRRGPFVDSTMLTIALRNRR
jgi:hypothetical protein